MNSNFKFFGLNQLEINPQRHVLQSNLLLQDHGESLLVTFFNWGVNAQLTSLYTYNVLSLDFMAHSFLSKA